MIARSIWERSARANFSKDNQIAQARRTSAIFSLRKITLVMFPVFIRNCCLKVLENFYSGPPVHTLISFLEARLLASFSFAWGSFGILPQILIENVVTFSSPVRHNVLLCFHFSTINKLNFNFLQPISTFSTQLIHKKLAIGYSTSHVWLGVKVEDGGKGREKAKEYKFIAPPPLPSFPLYCRSAPWYKFFLSPVLPCRKNQGWQL